MTSKVLVIGANGGIGKACINELIRCQISVESLDSTQLDLNYPEKIFDLDLTLYDWIINCAGHSQGTYKGFLDNDWANQVSQINVNYIANLALLKHYANSRPQGKYIWINSTLTHNARPFHSVYASTKTAAKFAIDLIRQEAAHIEILEIMLGLVRTNFKFRNFEGTHSQEAIDKEYDEQPALNADYVATQIINAAMLDTKELWIK